MTRRELEPGGESRLSFFVALEGRASMPEFLHPGSRWGSVPCYHRSCPWPICSVAHGSVKDIAGPRRAGPPYGSRRQVDWVAEPQHFLYFLPLPQGQGSFLPGWFLPAASKSRMRTQVMTLAGAL